MRLLALAPAYNEEGNIEKLIEGLRAELPEADILIINDCSTDGTERILSSTKGIRYIDLPFNMGIGGAVLSGFTYFLENSYDFLIRHGGDGQHPRRGGARKSSQGAAARTGRRPASYSISSRGITCLLIRATCKHMFLLDLLTRPESLRASGPGPKYRCGEWQYSQRRYSCGIIPASKEQTTCRRSFWIFSNQPICRASASAIQA